MINYPHNNENSSNKRVITNRAKRIERLIKVEFGNELRKSIDFIRNLSKTGLFIATHNPFDKGEIIEVKFQLPTMNYPIKVKAKVVWSRSVPEGKTKVRGMGVRFLNLAPWDEVLLNDFIESQRKI